MGRLICIYYVASGKDGDVVMRNFAGVSLRSPEGKLVSAFVTLQKLVTLCARPEILTFFLPAGFRNASNVVPILSVLFALAVVIGLVFNGPLVNVVSLLGCRNSSILFACCVSLSCLWMSLASQVWAIWLGFIFIRLSASHAIDACVTKVLDSWFVAADRSTACHAVDLGVQFVCCVVPWVFVIANDWRITWLMMASFVTFLLLPLIVCIVRDSPQEVGIAATVTLTPNAQEGDWTLRLALRTSTVHVVFFSIFICSLITNGLAFHLSHLSQRYTSDIIGAALLLSARAIGVLVVGFIPTPDPTLLRPLLVLAMFVFSGFSLSMLHFSHLPARIAAAILWAVASSLLDVTKRDIWTAYFGQPVATALEWITMKICTCGMAVGVLIFGIFVDKDSMLFIILACFLGTCGLGCLTASKPLYTGRQATFVQLRQLDPEALWNDAL
eukprot:GILK01007636.1.p1 GENE.GILK01007636.1~~GILK01007636.1.p1  ORF type:complete len:442 (+),score=50.76 GILK01007636.1:22-1347(+)